MQLTQMAVLAAGLILSSSTAIAQGMVAQGAVERRTSSLQDSMMVWELPEMIVVANKEASAAQSLPISVTTIPRETIADAGIRVVKDAAVYAPNVLMGDFGPRRLSNPYFRGIGAGPNNPGVSTSLDGVPQLSANSASIELVDVDQIEFSRGAQGALFGRNSLGGVINISSRRPSLKWGFESEGVSANNDFGTCTIGLSGPVLPGTLGVSLKGGYSRRDGYTENTVTSRGVDDREAWFGKGQLWFTAGERFEAQLIFSGEQDRDGDYALGDLAALKSTPLKVAHDFIGHTHRDVLMPTLVATWYGDAVEAKSISGWVRWKVDESTDLDYSAFPLMTSQNSEAQNQITQEFRLASKSNRPLVLTDWLSAGWQVGVFGFHQDYDREDVIDLLPAMTKQPVVLNSRTIADIVTNGVGIYGQGMFKVREKLALTAGLRFDSEHAQADLSLAPAFALPSQQQVRKDFHEVSPQFGLNYQVKPGVMIYVSAGRGYKAGGFNAGAPSGSESYAEEHSWNHEMGLKTRWMENRLQVNSTLFYIRWDDLQMYVPNSMMPGNYFVDNVGKAESKGLELEVLARPLIGWELFGSFGWTNAAFLKGSRTSVANLDGHRLPLTPEFTGNFGTQYSLWLMNALKLYARAEVTICGPYDYDVSNTMGQDLYNLADFRLGVQYAVWSVEGWVKNAFDTEYIPVAFAYQTAPSGYLGEYGAPMTFGIRGGLRF